MVLETKLSEAIEILNKIHALLVKRLEEEGPMPDQADHHRAAAKAHEEAVDHHLKAAEAHEDSDHEAAKEHSTNARNAAVAANVNTEAAHRATTGPPLGGADPEPLSSS